MSLSIRQSLIEQQNSGKEDDANSAYRLRPRLADEPLNVWIFSSLREKILLGQLQPGVALPEIRIGKANKVSQSTVREALASLERQALVSKVAGKGSVVTRLSGVDMFDRVVIRIALEPLALLEASDVLTVEQRHELTILALAMDDDPAADSGYLWHEKLWLFAGKNGSTADEQNQSLKDALISALAPVFIQSHNGERPGLKARQRLSPSKRHLNLLKAIESKDAKTIRESVIEHTLEAASLRTTEEVSMALERHAKQSYDYLARPGPVPIRSRA